MSTEDIQQLAYDEYDRLQYLLETHCVMSLEMMDGFFAALQVGPVRGAPGDYLPIVLGGDKSYEEAFLNLDEAREFIKLALQHWNSVAELLDTHDFFAPMLKDDFEEADGNEWATGFIQGVKAHSDKWKEFLNYGKNAGPMAPIFALHYQFDPDPEMRPNGEIPDQEQRQQLIAAAATGVMEIKQYFDRQLKVVKHENTIRRDAPKVGRNEPCPCGSGKKHKKCCGAV